MERHVQRFLNRLSFASITIATFTLLVLVIRTPETCLPPTASSDHLRFPKSTCDSSARSYLSLEKKNRRLWSTRNFRSQVSSYSDFFRSLQSIGLLRNHSRVICVSAGAGHEVMALSEIGVSDVSGVEVVDSPPLVSRADPHNLPFFDDAFDLAFTARLSEALFPWRFAAEMERTVRRGGACVVAVEECGDEEVGNIVGLFRNSKLLGAQNVTLIVSRMTRIIMRVKMRRILIHVAEEEMQDTAKQVAAREAFLARLLSHPATPDGCEPPWPESSWMPLHIECSVNPVNFMNFLDSKAFGSSDIVNPKVRVKSSELLLFQAGCKELEVIVFSWQDMLPLTILPSTRGSNDTNLNPCSEKIVKEVEYLQGPVKINLGASGAIANELLKGYDLKHP